MDVNNSYGNQVNEPRWFYAFNGQTVGPIPQSELLWLLNSGTISPQTPVVKEDTPNWVPVSSVFVVANNVSTVPTGKISNTLVWIVAFIPILSIILQIIGLDNTSYLSLVTLGFCFADLRKLKKAGYTLKYQTLWAWLFTPVYLFRRAKLLNQKYTYAIILSVSLALDVTAVILLSPTHTESNQGIEYLQEDNTYAPLLTESENGTLFSTLTVDEFREQWNEQVIIDTEDNDFKDEALILWGLSDTTFNKTVASPFQIVADETLMRDAYNLLLSLVTLSIDYDTESKLVFGIQSQYQTSSFEDNTDENRVSILFQRPAKMASILTGKSEDELVDLLYSAFEKVRDEGVHTATAYSDGVVATISFMSEDVIISEFIFLTEEKHNEFFPE